MILARIDGGIRVVRQVDHQDQCALMADSWGNMDFERLDHFAALRQAAAIHDEGWREWEGAPDVLPDGRPVDFPQIDRETHVGLYTKGIETACAVSPRVGLLVSLHGRGLYTKRLAIDGEPPAHPPGVERAFLAQEVDRQMALAAELGMDDPLTPWSWAAYRLLQAWDQLSLYLVWTPLVGGRTSALVRVPRREADDTGVSIALTPSSATSCVADPWPFSSSEVALPVACRTIEDRIYRDRDDLTATFRATKAERVRFTVHAP